MKAYKRRYNTELPNLSKDEIYAEYYRIVLYRLREFLKGIWKRFNLPSLVKIILKLLPVSIIDIKSKIRILKLIF